MSVLYVTQNGVTDHIGRSQVAPYVLGLARDGFRIHVLSAEKPGQDALIAQYQELFDAAGVRWTRVPYRNRPPLIGQAMTQALMKRAAQRIVRQEAIRVVHCRSFPPALIAYQLKPSMGVKYIFDFRDFYADGGLEKAHGLARLAFRRLKQLEGPMIRNADKVVCLTEQAGILLANWYLKDTRDAARRFKVIPCCADFDHFDLTKVSSQEIERARNLAGLSQDEFVLLYLGSLGPDYLLPQMIALFRQVLLHRPDAKFLFVSNNGRELVDAECQKQDVPRGCVRFVSADRNYVPSYIALASMSVFFYREGLRSVGCSPTKLAELFACNIPVIANSGVGDLDSIIDIHRNGSWVVKDFSDASLGEAVKKVLDKRANSMSFIRENSKDFALEEGVRRYGEVYRELLSS